MADVELLVDGQAVFSYNRKKYTVTRKLGTGKDEGKNIFSMIVGGVEFKPAEKASSFQVARLRKFEDPCPLLMKCKDEIVVSLWEDEGRNLNEKGEYTSFQRSMVTKKMPVKEAMQRLLNLAPKVAATHVNNAWFNINWKELGLESMGERDVWATADFAATADLQSRRTVNSSINGHAHLLVCVAFRNFRRVPIVDRNGDPVRDGNGDPVTKFLYDIESFCFFVPTVTKHKGACFEVFFKVMQWISTKYDKVCKKEFDGKGLNHFCVSLDNAAGQFRNSQHCWAASAGKMLGEGVKAKYSAVFATPGKPNLLPFLSFFSLPPSLHFPASSPSSSVDLFIALSSVSFSLSALSLSHIFLLALPLSSSLILMSPPFFRLLQVYPRHRWRSG